MFEKFFKRDTSPKEEVNESRRMFLRKGVDVVKNVAIVSAGAAALGKESLVFAGTSEKKDGQIERDYEKDFSLGIEMTPETENSLEKEIINNDRTEAEDISGGVNYTSEGEGLEYKRKAFVQMTAKYGKERLFKFFDLLDSSYPNSLREKNNTKEAIFTSYSREFPRMPDVKDLIAKTEVNKKLYNIADHMEPGEIEKLSQLLSLLREEGYDRKYDFSWNGKMIDQLLSQADERRAMIEFQNLTLDGGQGGVKLLKLKRAYKEKGDFESLPFKERLKEFRNQQ